MKMKDIQLHFKMLKQNVNIDLPDDVECFGKSS